MSKKQRKFIKEFKIKNQISKIEPIFETDSKEEKLKILRWYRFREIPIKTQRQWILTYLGKEKKQLLTEVHDSFFHHPFSSMCRMATRGYKFNIKDREFMSLKIQSLIALGKKSTKTKPIKVNTKLESAVMEIDSFVDEYFENKFESKCTILLGAFNLSKIEVKSIIEKITQYIDEYTEIKSWAHGSEEDKEYFASYNISMTKLNKFIKYLNSIIEECKSWAKTKQTINRVGTIRKKKIKSPEEICKRVKISKNNTIPITKLLTAQKAVILNEKTNKIAVLVTNGEPFEIKGSTITNINESLSEIFSVKKKFKDNFKELFQPKMNKSRIKVLFDGKTFRKSKATPVGRLNANKIILTIA